MERSISMVSRSTSMLSVLTADSSGTKSIRLSRSSSYAITPTATHLQHLSGYGVMCTKYQVGVCSIGIERPTIAASCC
eukprot:scaffold161925_cov50-Prasinocladus_malaysianus.AAC.1